MRVAALGIGLLASMLSTVVAAAILNESFDLPFPTWESAWFGLNSDLVSWYHADR